MADGDLRLLAKDFGIDYSGIYSIRFISMFELILSFMLTIPPGCSKIMKVSELKELLRAESRKWTDHNEQLKTNAAFIYYLNSGQVILLPSDVNDESSGLLFENKDCF